MASFSPPVRLALKCTINWQIATQIVRSASCSGPVRVLKINFAVLKLEATIACSFQQRSFTTKSHCEFKLLLHKSMEPRLQHTCKKDKMYFKVYSWTLTAYFQCWWFEFKQMFRIQVSGRLKQVYGALIFSFY